MTTVPIGKQPAAGRPAAVQPAAEQLAAEQLTAEQPIADPLITPRPVTERPVTVQPVRVTPGWLALREPADAAARSTDLVDLVRPHLPTGDRTVIHDLGCGTGSMARWLAPLLPGRQHWAMYDRDDRLLEHAAADPPASDGAVLCVETRRRDITRLAPLDLVSASLITASALLDMFTVTELDRFVHTCVRAECPVLLTISVIGRVELTPAEPLDVHVTEAFNAHQRRTAGGRRLLGPDAVEAAASAFTRFGSNVVLRPSPWQLGAGQAELTVEWLSGWLAAAYQQQPELAASGADYARRRMAQAAAGELSATVHHLDLLALPG